MGVQAFLRPQDETAHRFTGNQINKLPRPQSYKRLLKSKQQNVPGTLIRFRGFFSRLLRVK